MLCFSFSEGKLTKGIDHDRFYSPLLSGCIKEASVRVVAGGSWNLTTLANAIKENLSHALLCCLIELIPPTGNKSSIFPAETCLLCIPAEIVETSPADNSILFASEGKYRLYGCRPGSTALRIGAQQIINDNGKLKLVEAPPLLEQIDDPYHQYKGQDISVLELL